MGDIFISYARATAAVAQDVADAFRALGYSVWRDDELPAHLSYTRVIEERLTAAKAVVVIWSAEAARSEWVQSEADRARNARKLVQMNIDGAQLPMPFDRIQCADLSDWNGELTGPGWAKVVASVAELIGSGPPPAPKPVPARTKHAQKTVLAVLAFDNLSGDPDMEYFSDGISEEIQLTVARGADLRIIGRASSFQFRGADKAASHVGESLGATHILDGSVRRSGARIRIVAQLVECAKSTLLWSERFDRELSDIFAMQDEIAIAVSAALKLAFSASPQPQSIDPSAYDRYLRARAIGREDMSAKAQGERMDLLERVVEVAPTFAQAWGSLATAKAFAVPRTNDNPDDPMRVAARNAAERAIDLDANCGVAYTALAYLRPAYSDYAEKLSLFEQGYARTPDDTWTLAAMACALTMVGRAREGLKFWEKVVEHEPLSPRYAMSRAFFYAGAGQVDYGLELTADVAARFPNWREGDGGQLLIAINGGRLDVAERIVGEAPEKFAVERAQLRGLQQIAALGPAERAGFARGRLEATVGACYMSDFGQAADMGEPDLAFASFHKALDERRPLGNWKGEEDNVGRAVASLGLFSIVCRNLRPDPRFAGICVRLGLYDYWRDSGMWPDCVEDLAPYYDFQAECEKAAAALAS